MSTPQEKPGEESGEGTRGRGAELVVLVLLGATTAFALAFVLLFALYDNHVLLGLSLGLSLACLAAAAVVAAERIFPQETAVEERPELVHEEDVEEVDRLVREAGEGVSRRRLLGTAGGGAGAALTAALVVPLASLGPDVGSKIVETPWKRGRRLVDHEGVPVRAEDIEEGSLVTAFPEGADRRELGSPVVLVRLPPEEVQLPPDRLGGAPEGIIAYSKICTHAGCAISLYRHPLYEPTSREPALVCPCHYSTFSVRRGAEVIFGPAARALPQLPLEIAPDGVLLAGGGFSGPIGPAWWSVRKT